MGCNLLRLDDYLLAHEAVETHPVEVRVACADQIAILLLEPDLHEVFSLLHGVVRLQVVDDAHVVDVLAVRADEAVAVLLATLFERFD
jgi:hypothetical protein